MRKLSEIQNEDALDVLADIIDPVTEIFQDQELGKLMKLEKNKREAVKLAIKKHKKAVIHIMAILDGEPVETYKVNVLQLPLKLLELLNDPDMLDFFKQQGLMISDASSGSATESTEATEEK